MVMEILSAQTPGYTHTQTLPPTRPQRLSTITTSQQPQLTTPTSQDSIISAYSSASSSNPSSLQTSTSNLSQSSALTELSSAADNAAFKRGMHTVSMQQRTPTPDEDYALTSPMSITSPAFANGTKRTASGHIKNAASMTDAAPYMKPSPGRTRAESMSSTGSRVGDLAASLKMRLGYAMTKVQYGWEHKTIGELERLTASKPQANVRPSTAISYMYTRDYQPVDGVMSPPAKRRSGMFGAAAIVQGVSAPRLQPPADIHTQSHRHSHTRSADLRSLPLANGDGMAMSPPQTPVASFPRRPPTIRTDTQTAEAERDALQALTQLGSPHNSQYSRHYNVSQGNSSQASPLRTEFGTSRRRVSFARGNSDSSLLDTSSEDGTAAGPTANG